MSPRALIINGYDFFFYSREEKRRHIHIERGGCDAKVWLEPTVEIAYNHGFNNREIRQILQIIEENERGFNDKWDNHFVNK